MADLNPSLQNQLPNSQIPEHLSTQCWFISKDVLRGNKKSQCVQLLCASFLFMSLLWAEFLSWLCSNSTAAMSQSSRAVTTLTAKWRLLLIHDKHGTAVFYWWNKGIGRPSLLMRRVQVLTVKEHKMLREWLSNFSLILLQTEGQTQCLHITTPPPLSEEDLYFHCVVRK